MGIIEEQPPHRLDPGLRLNHRHFDFHGGLASRRHLDSRLRRNPRLCLEPCCGWDLDLQTQEGFPSVFGMIRTTLVLPAQEEPSRPAVVPDQKGALPFKGNATFAVATFSAASLRWSRRVNGRVRKGDSELEDLIVH